jgi:hypothetical protein
MLKKAEDAANEALRQRLQDDAAAHRALASARRAVEKQRREGRHNGADAICLVGKLPAGFPASRAAASFLRVAAQFTRTHPFPRKGGSVDPRVGAGCLAMVQAVEVVARD